MPWPPFCSDYLFKITHWVLGSKLPFFWICEKFPLQVLWRHNDVIFPKVINICMLFSKMPLKCHNISNNWLLLHIMCREIRKLRFPSDDVTKVKKIPVIFIVVWCSTETPFEFERISSELYILHNGVFDWEKQCISSLLCHNRKYSDFQTGNTKPTKLYLDTKFRVNSLSNKEIIEKALPPPRVVDALKSLSKVGLSLRVLGPGDNQDVIQPNHKMNFCGHQCCNYLFKSFCELVVDLNETERHDCQYNCFVRKLKYQVMLRPWLTAVLR